jgi:GTPase
MKAGIVALIGRPNVGKSTLLNNILGQKVSITSPKPQTTRFLIQAVLEEERGQIVFIDTPGIFNNAKEALSKIINPKAEEALSTNIDLVLYVIDHTRERSTEENRALGIVRKTTVPKILVVNKIDIKHPTYMIQYLFMQEEFDRTVEVSALKRSNINRLVDMIFEFLPEREPIVDTSRMIQPGLNLDSKTFISEIIREKAFLFLRSELPYTLTTVVDEISERDNGTMYVKARVLTTDDRYKAMIVGKNGFMVKEISMAARKELEAASNKPVYLDLTVETDPHWMSYLQ